MQGGRSRGQWKRRPVYFSRTRKMFCKIWVDEAAGEKNEQNFQRLTKVGNKNSHSQRFTSQLEVTDNMQKHEHIVGTLHGNKLLVI